MHFVENGIMFRLLSTLIRLPLRLYRLLVLFVEVVGVKQETLIAIDTDSIVITNLNLILLTRTDTFLFFAS